MGPGPFIRHGHRFHGGGIPWGALLLWILFMIAFWALVITAIVWMVRSMTGRRRHYAMGGPAGPWRGTASAEQILAERYAHGQIDENEYRRGLATLRGEYLVTAPPPSPPPPPAPPPEE